MNHQPDSTRMQAMIELAHVRDFSLGAMRVRPSIREVECAGKTESLEPRVMKVLVALTDAGGAVVSRDDLIARCWEGRIVGEDAINRAVGRLRRFLEDRGGSAFTVETIPRVGYRLKAEMPLAADAQDAPAQKTHWRAGPWRIAVSVALLLVAAVIAAWLAARAGEWGIDPLRDGRSTPPYENDSALAPNGAMIAYATGPAPRHIFVDNLLDGHAIRLTSGGDDMQPVWSPDSDRIAFIRHHGGTPCTIIVKPVPGGDEHVAGHCRQDDVSTLAWHGDALYFSDRGAPQAPRQIMRLDLADDTVRPVTFPPDHTKGDTDPVFSPDGTKMVFLRATKGSDTYLVLDLASGAIRRIATR